MNEDTLARLERLAKLMQQGIITPEEFVQQKAALLSTTPASPLPAPDPAAGQSSPPVTPAPTPKKTGLGRILLYVFLGLIVLSAIANIIDPKPKTSSVTTADSTAAVAEPADAPKSRKDIVAGFFSAWDGSHRELEKAIKSSMNDPDSYKHEETRFRDDGKTIYVVTSFRGKNAFGGTILNGAQATLDGTDGHLIKWKYLK